MLCEVVERKGHGLYTEGAEEPGPPNQRTRRCLCATGSSSLDHGRLPLRLLPSTSSAEWPDSFIAVRAVCPVSLSTRPLDASAAARPPVYTADPLRFASQRASPLLHLARLQQPFTRADRWAGSIPRPSAASIVARARPSCRASRSAHSLVWSCLVLCHLLSRAFGRTGLGCNCENTTSRCAPRLQIEPWQKVYQDAARTSKAIRWSVRCKVHSTTGDGHHHII